MNVRREDGILILDFEGDFHSELCVYLQNAEKGKWISEDTKGMILDLTKASGAGEAAIKVMFLLREILRKRGGDLVLINIDRKWDEALISSYISFVFARPKEELAITHLNTCLRAVVKN